jgi:hypothetical protein
MHYTSWTLLTLVISVTKAEIILLNALDVISTAYHAERIDIIPFF